MNGEFKELEKLVLEDWEEENELTDEQAAYLECMWEENRRRQYDLGRRNA